MSELNYKGEIIMETIAFNDFMNGNYKKEKYYASKNRNKKTKIYSLKEKSHSPTLGDENLQTKKSLGGIFPLVKVGTSITIPLLLAKPAFAASPVAVPVNAATEFAGHTAIETLAHALDPLVNILVALSFPVASVIIVGGCFFFMIGKSEKGWSSIMNAGLGYVLIQISPLILNMLKDIGNAF